MAETTKAETNKVGAVYAGIKAAREYFYKRGFDKSGWNDKQKFKFRTIDGLWPLIQQALSAGNLILVPMLRDYERSTVTNTRGDGSTSTMTYSVVTTNYRVTSLEDGSYVDSPFTGEGADSLDKSMSKAHSMCHKYWAIAFFQIPVEGQDDADASERTAHEPDQDSRPEPVADPAARLVDLIAKMKDAASEDELLDLFGKGRAYINNRSLGEDRLAFLKQEAAAIAKEKGWR